MTITITQLYRSLSKKLGEETAEDLTTYVQESIKEELNQRTDIFMTKEDKVDLIDKIRETEITCIKWFIIAGMSQTAIILGFLYFMLRK